MSIFKALTRIAFSPITIAAEVVKDISGENSDEAQGLSILTVGVSSVVKGAAKVVVDAAEEVSEE